MAKEEPPKDAKTDTEAKAKPAKSKMGLILIVIVVLLAGAGGFFGWNHFQASKTEAASAADEGALEVAGEEEGVGSKKKKKRKKKILTGATISLDPFLVNLAGSKGGRYLKASVRLMVKDKKAVEALNAAEIWIPKIRDTVVDILSSKTSDEVLSPEGKRQLKEQILESINEFLPGEGAQEVFFTDLVVQL